MIFNPDTWWLVTLLVGAVLSVIGYFLKHTMSKVDEHDRDIGQIKQTYITKSKADEYDRDIGHIKQTYVTKNEFKDQRTEFREELTKISDTVDEIRENCLSKVDFYRAQADTNENIKRVYDLLIKINGGKTSG